MQYDILPLGRREDVSNARIGGRLRPSLHEIISIWIHPLKDLARNAVYILYFCDPCEYRCPQEGGGY